MPIDKKTDCEHAEALAPAGIESEFSIHTELTDLPLSECPVYLEEVIGGVCISGSAVLTVFNTRFTILPGMVILMLPWQLVSIREVSGDFSLTFYRASEEMFTDSLSSLWRITPDFFFFISKHIASEAAPDNIKRFLNYCDLLEYRTKFVQEACRRESIMQLLRVFFWDRYTFYISESNSRGHKFNYTRKEEFAYRFLRMLLEDHSPDKDVAYYAEKLGVSRNT